MFSGNSQQLICRIYRCFGKSVTKCQLHAEMYLSQAPRIPISDGSPCLLILTNFQKIGSLLKFTTPFRVFITKFGFHALRLHAPVCHHHVMFLEILCVMEYLQIFLFQFIVMSFCACLLMQTFSQNIFWFFSLRSQCLFKHLFI